MSQITTCPSCSTRFRVVADQLRISDGWVRCGQCQEVFDARNHLNASAAASIAPVAASTAVIETSTSSATTRMESAPPRPVQAIAPSEPVMHRVAADSTSPLAVASTVAATVVDNQAMVPTAQVVSAAPVVPTRVVNPPAAPPPGYELPAPQWSDDIDFSEYQPDSADAMAPPSLPQNAAQQLAARVSVPVSSPALMDAVPQVVRQHAQATAAAVPRSAEPAWSAAARGPSAAKDAFPPLDLSLLKTRASAQAAVASPAAGIAGEALEAASRTTSAVADQSLSQIGISSNHSELEQLSEHEHLKPSLRGADFAALDSHLHGELRPTALPRSGPGRAGEVLEADIGPTTLRQDNMESIAQKLAQAQPDATGLEPEACGTFARHDFGDDALDSSLEPGFVREARRKAWWQKPMVRVAMGAAVVVLPVALALQVALHERNALASWQPSARPALEFMCTALQCTLAPRQQIRAMVVTGSAFAKGEADRSYQLSLSIQNQASTPVGVPAVELTLTDSQDQAIARKVIQTKELGAPVELTAGSEWSGTVPVTTEGLNLQVSGYRVLLFYP